jgi:poly(3-hydroxybutyrate) depolymerase
MRRAWALLPVAGMLVAGACGGSNESNGTSCGPGTVWSGSQCVVADAGAGGCDGNDCGSGDSGGKSSGGNNGGNGGMPAGNSGMPASGSSNGGSATSGTSNGGSGGTNATQAGSGGSAEGGGSPGTETAGAPNGGSPDAGAAGISNGGAAGVGNDITDVVKSAGCGTTFAGVSGAKVTIQTSGVKDANCADKLQDGTPKCGPWSTPRDYYVYLPQDYDKNRAYPLVFDLPGCGATGLDVYSLGNAQDNVIRVGLTPGPNSLGHGTNPGQGCFDAREGDDNIDFVFYENLVDKLKGELCFDRNRVFAAGDSLGAWMADELGCHYAGDALHPIRGVLANDGGLPTQVAYKPTCSGQPMAGMWVHDVGDAETPFISAKAAIKQAMAVNGCTIGTDYDTAQFQNYPIGGGNPIVTCQKMMGCPALYPLVVCPLPGNDHSRHEAVANPGFGTFLTGLMP